MRRANPILLLILLSIQIGCGTSNGSGGKNPPPAVAVGLSAASPDVRLGSTDQVTATVTGSSNHNVNWFVNAIAGGNATVGTISASGVYSAPSAMPSRRHSGDQGRQRGRFHRNRDDHAHALESIADAQQRKSADFCDRRIHADGERQQVRERRASRIRRRGDQYDLRLRDKADRDGHRFDGRDVCSSGAAIRIPVRARRMR